VKKTTQLKKMISERRAVVAPGCYDVLSAKLIEEAGFELTQVSGFGVSACLLGKPDVGLLGWNEVVNMTWRVCQAVNIPVMGDGDTGFGNALNVIRTVQDFIQVGAAGVNLEDQVFPKRCGHMEGKQLVSEEEMVLKIEAAVEARKALDPDFVINARTDAIAVSGYEDAIHRSNAYAKAGADMIFLEAPTDKEMIRDAVSKIDAPLSVNLFDSIVGGKTPLIPIEELAELGVARVSVPVGTIFVVTKWMREYLSVLKERGIMPDRTDLLCTFDEFKQFVGLPEYKELEKRFLPKAVVEQKYGDK
jgi:2-methylisocitrate lyase-like PEP mutase family enzyme